MSKRIDVKKSFLPTFPCLNLIPETLIDEFGPDREKKGLYPEIAPSNAFIGLYIRLDMLSELGAHDTVLSNILGLFTDMAKSTRTLREDKYGAASCNHSFASHVLVWLRKAGVI